MVWIRCARRGSDFDCGDLCYLSFSHLRGDEHRDIIFVAMLLYG